MFHGFYFSNCVIVGIGFLEVRVEARGWYNKFRYNKTRLKNGGNKFETNHKYKNK